MFLKGKPIRFGYTVWMLCGNVGYPYHMIIYQGKEIHASKVPLSTRVISTMVDIIQESSNTTRHTLYFDNFFNSYDLLVNLSGLKMRAIGTIRPYRRNGADATAYCVLSNNKKQKMVLAFVYQCGEHCYSGCLADSLLRRRQTTQPPGVPSTSSPELAAVGTNSDTKSGIRPYEFITKFYSSCACTKTFWISDYTKDGCSIFTTLSIHFFGSDHKSTLSYVDFHRFIRNFQIEVWEFQFMTFSTSKKDLTELEFAKMIYSYIYLPLHHQEQFFKRLEAKSHLNLLNRISFEEVCKFFTLLNNLNNFSYALHLCNLSNDLLTHAEFQRAVNASCGFKFQPNVVSSIFNVFSADNNGKLSVNEFISMLQNCRQSFIFFKEPAQSHTLLDNYKQCVRSKVMQSLSSFK
ncbi:Calcium uptake protein 3, mitochondrial [Trichinella nelsoni]|uniref:Calcium uptake protein 3, mitochondrial n=1 Tax=Trichinella nelsoni TaxID=6336 RepID=A0A0V0S6I6_9BILA|nr:Calcium uptake protein 3, mitochondrial [Trichinella nelsoni]